MTYEERIEAVQRMYPARSGTVSGTTMPIRSVYRKGSSFSHLNKHRSSFYVMGDHEFDHADMTAEEKRNFFTKRRSRYICETGQRKLMEDVPMEPFQSDSTKSMLSKWHARRSPRKYEILHKLIVNDMELLMRKDVPLPPFFPYHINDGNYIGGYRFKTVSRPSESISGVSYDVDDPSESIRDMIASARKYWTNEVYDIRNYKGYSKRPTFYKGPPNEFYTLLRPNLDLLWAFNFATLKSLPNKDGEIDSLRWGHIHPRRIKFGNRIIGHPYWAENAEKYKDYFFSIDPWKETLGENYTPLLWLSGFCLNYQRFFNLFETKTISTPSPERKTMSEQPSTQEQLIDAQHIHITELKASLAQAQETQQELKLVLEKEKKEHDELKSAVQGLFLRSKKKVVKETIKEFA